MRFLPIAERELRVAARRKSSYRLRILAALVAMLVSSVFLGLTMMGGISRNPGAMMFTVLTYYAFGISLLAGIFITADSLSEEKREGTLGLLFLTDLRGYDVVLGKFIALSLNAFYSLIAMLPVLAITLLTGGVTGAEFARVSLALVNVLFCSMAAGMLISTFSRDLGKSFAGTALLLGVFLFGGLILDGLQKSGPILSLASPAYAFKIGFENYFLRSSGDFWLTLAISHGVGWLFLVIASLALPHVWQDRPQRTRQSRSFTLTPNASQARAQTRRTRLLDRDPMLWLISREGEWHILPWGLVVVALMIGAFSNFGTGPRFSGSMMGTGYLLRLVVLLPFKLIFALQACRFIVDARRTGALELLLSTPLTVKQIIAGQWLALRRVFLWPLVCLSALLATPLIYLIWLAIWRGTPEIYGQFMSLAWLGLHPFEFVMDLLALGWLGMWLALTSRRPQFAAAHTLLFIVFLPSIAFCVPVVWLFVDVGVILWARAKLLQQFRARVMQQYQPIVASNLPLPAQRPPPLPRIG